MKTESYETRTWAVTLITPLHLGDGQEMSQNLDYLPAKEGLRVIRIDDVLEGLLDHPAAIREMGNRGFDLSQLAREGGVDLRPRYTLPYSGDRAPESLRRFLKDGYGAPYLAGSTLKGAVRTALWTGLDRSQLPPARNFQHIKAYQRAVNGISGSDPHHDFLRPLSISDSPGIEPEGALRVEEIKFFNRLNGDRPGWKDLPSRRNLNRFGEASGLFVEAIKPDTTLYVQVRLDRNLTRGPGANALGLPPCNGLADFGGLSREINRHSLSIAEAERDFFGAFGAETGAVTGFYNQLITGIQEIAKNPEHQETFVLRMAWGSGWRGMTGGWLEGEDLEAVRRMVTLGRKGADLFPKTRRLAMMNGSPSAPLGWVVVRPAESAAFYRKPKAEPDHRTVNETAPAEPEETAAVSGEEPPEVPEEPPATIEAETERWTDVLLTWSPGNQEVTATSAESKKASGIGKDLVPASLQKKLFNRKRTNAEKVTVEAVGNAFRIIRINSGTEEE